MTKHEPAITLSYARRTVLQLKQAHRKMAELERKMEMERIQHEQALERKIGVTGLISRIGFVDPIPAADAPVPISISKAKDGETPTLWACPQCGRTFSRQAWAEDCIASHAPKPCACGETIRYDGQSKCDACRLRDNLRRAKQVSEAEYGDWVFSEDFAGYRDGYFESVAEFRDEWADAAVDDDNFGEMPCYVWACKENVWEGIDIERVIESELEYHHEGAELRLVDEQELHEFVSEWNKKQIIATRRQDYDRVVVLDQARFDALIGGNDGEG